MDDLISRKAAIDALWKALYEYEDKTEKQFIESEELDVADWIQHRIFVQNMSDIDRQTIRDLPSAQPDISAYSDKLWKAAYERGKAEAQPDLDDVYAHAETEAEARYHAQQRWIPCSERLPEEYGEYRITWVTSCVPSKRFIGDSEYEVTSVWDEERKGFKGEWLLDDYIKYYPDVKVIAWKPLEEPYRGEGEK